MVRVIYKDGTEDLVAQKFLDILLFLDEVKMFRRSGQWVVVGVDPIREAGMTRTTSGEERRIHRQTDIEPLELALA